MSDIIKNLEWAIDTIREQVLFGLDELGGAKARERRAKGVMLDACKEIKTLEEKLKALANIVEDFILEDTHLHGCAFKNFGHDYDCHCMDRNYYNRDDVMSRAKEAFEKIKEK
jgi:hypothetical protein